MQRVNFDVGERRHVKLLIHATDSAPFMIRNARWELRYGGVVESDGECEIDGHIVDSLISPERRTTYILRIEYEIANEVLVEQIEVAVT